MVRDMRGMRGKGALGPTEMVRDMRDMRGKVLWAAGNRCAVSCPGQTRFFRGSNSRGSGEIRAHDSP